MASTGRVGTGLLGTFGLALAGLMAYTLAYEGCSGPDLRGPSDSVDAEVAVFFPDRREWSQFLEAVEACSRRGLGKVVAGSDGEVVVETPGPARRVRFGWHGTRGIRETRDEVERISRGESRPIGVIGSSTTVLTVALAEALRDQGPGGPVLMVPWATAVGSGGPVPLLSIDPGRTFRFCPDNRRLAGSVVDCLIGQDPRPPGRVYLVVDPHDPYSVDLADSFRRAILERAPSAEVVERAEAVGLPTVSRSATAALTPSVSEATLADEIWASMDGTPEGRTTWVVLPLQRDPTRRMLSALQARSSWRSPGRGERPLHVITGDAIGRETLGVPEARRSFPIWSASTSSVRPSELGVTDDTHTLAEIVSTVLLAVERSPRPRPTPDDLRDELARLDLPGSDPRAFGRPLGFAAVGERKNAPGHVLATFPGTPGVVEFGPGKDGWRRAEVDGSETPEARP